MSVSRILTSTSCSSFLIILYDEAARRALATVLLTIASAPGRRTGQHHYSLPYPLLLISSKFIF